MTVSNATNCGLSVWGSTAAPSAAFSTFSNNSNCGIWLQGGGGVTLTDSSLTGNGMWAVRAEPGTRLMGMTNVVVNGNGTVGAGDAVSYASGTITAAETWSSRIAWALQGWVSVGSPTTPGSLTIQPGTLVKFPANGSMYVSGTLTAVGTPASPILFTSSLPNPSAGAWGSISFYAGSSASRLAYATVEYAGAGGASATAVGIFPGSPTFDHLVVRHSAHHGIEIDGSSGVPAMSFLTLSDNATDDLYFDTGSLTVTNSTFAGVTGYGVYNATVGTP